MHFTIWFLDFEKFSWTVFRGYAPILYLPSYNFSCSFPSAMGDIDDRAIQACDEGAGISNFVDFQV